MSDSVDRVFSHALNTVNKIQTGSEKPPSSTRLKLYGLYKQSMEGDVDGIMDRPSGDSEDAQRARDKWDAWKEQNCISRTEAKRRYICTLLETMHKYASPSPDTRELVAELEFVWDQVKSNVPSSSSSSPLQTIGSVPANFRPTPSYSTTVDPPQQRQFRSTDRSIEQPLRVLSPLSQSQEEDDLEDNGEEFVDAPDSQYNDDDSPEDRHLSSGSESPSAHDNKAQGFVQPATNPEDQKWRRRVEQALTKMTTEVAALREQLESRRLFSYRRRQSIISWMWWFLWSAVKHIAIDFVLLVFILLWMRKRKDKRLESAMRFLSGDAVAQVQKVRGAKVSIGKIQLPKLATKKSRGP
ncbi:hypothetical protein M501DRAFT_991324 [Patellaria atrata CBS 101060]|uniref:ACB domain-containing protein n=1 Tax=Patellaria atrata CBS 101060 TaxID=1346257 RepID=A0A9P4VU70_9PEZI|nr:hypothetical protein M501DRAFT_991324 [Patellaria atrata CBS 101060]